jgi:hypothetical protein
MSVDINQTISQASLDNLNDIIIPDAVGLFPLAPGWIIGAALLLTLLFHIALKQYLHYKQTLYKKEGLQELESCTLDNNEGIVSILSLAKKVGIAAYGRQRVAKLDGNLWWDFMEQNSKVKVNKELRDNIAALLYEENPLDQSVHFEEIKSMVFVWIRTHKVVHHD